MGVIYKAEDLKLTCIESPNRLVTNPLQWFTVFPGGQEN
jgi:hypothetical protein